MYCCKNTMKPLSTADFGKVMKQVFPEVRARRLGTRGNSRYCYAGLCKMVHLPVPQLPNLEKLSQVNDKSNCMMEEIVCCWMGKVLGKEFDSLPEIGKYLISLENPESKLCTMSSSTNLKCVNQNTANEKKSEEQDANTETSAETGEVNQQAGTPCKNKAVHIVSRKRSSSTLLSENINYKKQRSCTKYKEKCSKGNNNVSKNKVNESVPENSSKSPFNTNSEPYKTSVGENIKNSTEVTDVEVNDKASVIHSGLKLPIPRLIQTCKNKSQATNLILLPAVISTSTKTKRLKPIQPSPSKDTAEETNSPIPTTDHISDKTGTSYSQVNVGCLEKDALNDYLYCDGNSQEEELMKYFQPQSTSISNGEEKIDHAGTASQLRFCLEKNSDNTINDKSLTTFTVDTDDNPASNAGVTSSQHNTQNSKLKNMVFPTLIFADLGTGRKISFENRSVPQSLNTRRKLFNFTPISPTKTKTISENQFVSPNQVQVSKTINFQTSTILSSPRQASPSQSNAVISTQLTSPKDSVSISGSVLQSSTSNLHTLSVFDTKSQPEVASEVNVSEDKQTIIFPRLIYANSNLSTPRRVSFENNSVPQKPKARKLFNFTPISPTKTKSMGENQFISPCHMAISKNSSRINTSRQISPNHSNSVKPIQSTSPQNSINSGLPSATVDSYLLSVITSKSKQESLTFKDQELNKLDIGTSTKNQIFQLPCSPVSSCESPEKAQSPKPAESSTSVVNQKPSLLQTILTHGTYKANETEEKKSFVGKNSVSKFNLVDPLSQEVSKFFPEGGKCTTTQAQITYRSHSVPIVSSATPFINNFSIFQNNCCELDSSVFATPVSSEVTDIGSITNADSSSSNLLMMTDENDLESLNYDMPSTQSNMFIDTDMNKIFEIIASSSKVQLGNSESERNQQPSRSYPNTPIPYSRDPIVSAFAPKPPRSYPTTPVFSSQLINYNPRNSSFISPKNYNLNFTDSAITQGLLTQEEEDNLSLELTGCTDTFSVLADETEEL